MRIKRDPEIDEKVNEIMHAISWYGGIAMAIYMAWVLN